VSDECLAIIKARLEAVLEPDSNTNQDGVYEIHSLYFDDLYDTCMRDNNQGLSERSKYRIRYYGDNPNFMRLEKKEKWQERCHKESCEISLQQFHQIVEGKAEEVLYNTDDLFLKKFCVECLTRGFMPKAIVDYVRIAFVEPITNVRITLDTNISVSDEIEEFLTGDYTRFPLQEARKQVLEVKFDYILPSYIRHVISHRELVRSSYSKYYLGRKQLQKKR
jgi:hypothetical protein